MTGQDYLIVLGLCFGAWAAGYVSGYVLRAVRQLIERITGAGSG